MTYIDPTHTTNYNNRSDSSSSNSNIEDASSISKQDHNTSSYNSTNESSSLHTNSFTQEDDDNTINSNETTTHHKQKQNSNTLPPYTRYQMMILLDQDSDNKPIDENEEIKPTLLRIQQLFQSLLKELNNIDSSAKIISWQTTPNYTYLDPANFPIDTPGIAKYFNGYRNNLKPDKRCYIKIGIYSPNKQDQIETKLHTYMQLLGNTFKKLSIRM